MDPGSLCEQRGNPKLETAMFLRKIKNIIET